MSIVSVSLDVIPALRSPDFQFQRPAVFVFYFCCSKLFCLVSRGRTEPPPPPRNFIPGRPKAALLFLFFGNFRCGVPLLIVIIVIIVINKYKNR